MPKGIYYRSPERLEELTSKILQQRRGPLSNAEKTALSERSIGNKYSLGAERSNESRKARSISLKGRPSPLRGRKQSDAHRLAVAEGHRRRVREGKHNFWKGGIYKSNQKLRGTVEYRLWRESVFERDNYTCQFCGIRGGRLNADHIKPFALFPDLRLELSNGRTLCEPCHKTTDTYGFKTKRP